MELSRRRFLLNSGAIGCSVAASPFITPVVLASAPVDSRLVVIILRGAMDGLDVLQPYGDPRLASWRPNFSHGPGGGAHDLDGFFALHQDLGELLPLWQSGELLPVHAVSTPYRAKRSHFDGQDLLENGGGANDGQLTPAGDGWLNRIVPLIGGHNERTAFAVGRERLRLISGDAPHSSWSPEADLKMSEQGRLLLELIYRDDPLFRDAARTAASLSDTIDSTMSPSAAGRAEALASFAAEQLNAETRLAAFSLGGFDTHRNQQKVLPKSLGQLQTAILQLKKGLGTNWDKTVVMAITEFGRTVAENGSGGTDHGTGGAMLLAGGAVKGGRVAGTWPGLGEAELYARRDLMPTDDLRRYAGQTIRGLFGVAASDIEKSIFQGLDVGADLQLLR